MTLILDLIAARNYDASYHFPVEFQLQWQAIHENIPEVLKTLETQSH